MNTHIKDNLGFLKALHGCRLYKGANQTVANGANDAITFNQEHFDTDAFHDTGSNNTRITVPSGMDGYYFVYAKLTSDADAGNHTASTIRLRKNAAGASGGGTLMDVVRGVGHTILWSVTLVWIGPLVATDHLEIFWESVSEAHDVQGGSNSDSVFSATLLGS
jgi:hypothetical protein